MEIEKTPYTEWLEGAVRMIFEEKPVCMALVATLRDGNTLTAYYNADAQDKAVFAHHIQSDVILDVVTANADLVKQAMEEAESDDQP